jgi:hypothetical protein
LGELQETLSERKENIMSVNIPNPIDKYVGRRMRMRRLMLAAYWNRTPILVSSRQMILQIRVGRSGIAKLNFEGSPDVVWT